ncbi:MAG: hypothetical protein EBT49_08275 [Betaproteobacteria bacterium]|nr:hypothetical protein [Betaproteobacteria bacterium]
MNRSRHLFLLACLLFCVNAFAVNWTAAGLHDLGIYYYDSSSVEHQGDKYRAWTMLDYRDPQKNKQGHSFKSTRAQMEFDCKDKRVRALTVSFHSGAKLTGEVLVSEGVFQDWMSVPPSTPMANIMKAVCAH